MSKSLSKEVYPYGFSASGGFPSGSILFVNDPKLLLDGEKCRAFIEPDPNVQFSMLSKGARGSLFARGRTRAGDISEWVYALAFLVMPEKPEYLRERILERSKWARFIQVMNQIEDEALVPFDSLENQLKKHIGDALVDLIERGGSRAVHELGDLIELIENKSKILPQDPLGQDNSLTQEELSFCEVLAYETCKIADVPTQKHVREAWIAQRAGRNEDQFKTIRDRLGFKWLPASKRGKNRI